MLHQDNNVALPPNSSLSLSLPPSLPHLRVSWKYLLTLGRSELCFCFFFSLHRTSSAEEYVKTRQRLEGRMRNGGDNWKITELGRGDCGEMRGVDKEAGIEN